MTPIIAAIYVYVCVCMCWGVCVCVSKSFTRICAEAYVVRQTIFDTRPCGVRHVASDMRHAAQKEAAQVSGRTVLKFTLEWSFCRCKQNVVVLAAVASFMGLSQGLGLGLGLGRVSVGSGSLVLVLGPRRCLIALLINFFAKRLQPLQLQLPLAPDAVAIATAAPVAAILGCSCQLLALCSFYFRLVINKGKQVAHEAINN